MRGSCSINDVGCGTRQQEAYHRRQLCHDSALIPHSVLQNGSNRYCMPSDSTCCIFQVMSIAKDNNRSQRWLRSTEHRAQLRCTFPGCLVLLPPGETTALRQIQTTNTQKDEEVGSLHINLPRPEDDLWIVDGIAHDVLLLGLIREIRNSFVNSQGSPAMTWETQLRSTYLETRPISPDISALVR